MQTFPDAPPLAPADAGVLARAAAVADRCAAFAEYNDDPRHGPRVGIDFPTTEFGWLRDAGLLADPLPRALGGSDLNAPGHWWTLLQVLKHIGRGCLPAGRIYEGHVNALALITRLGTPEQQARAADDVLAHGRISASGTRTTRARTPPPCGWPTWAAGVTAWKAARFFAPARAT